MASAPGRTFAERIFRQGIPHGALWQQCCRNWGLPVDRAAFLVDEAAAEAHRRALERSFESAEHYAAWVTRTALNCAVDILRQDARISPMPSEGWGTAPLPELDSTSVAECIARLSKEEQALIQLTYEEGLTLDEIADRLLPPGGSPNARRLRMKRKRDLALARLRDYLVRSGYGPATPNAGHFALS